MFVGLPISLRLLGKRLTGPLFSLGAGVQMVWPNQRPEAFDNPSPLALADLPFAKVTLAVAVPLMRWVPGLSLGFAYARLASIRNSYANANTVDLALSYRANRYLSLGLVGRNLNLPRLGDQAELAIREPVAIEPAIALRPLGTRAWELELGGRFTLGYDRAVAIRQSAPAQPRLRTRFGGRGVYAYAQGELYDHLIGLTQGGHRFAVRVNVGMEVELARVGVAAGAVAGLGSGSPLHGMSTKLRLSREDYPHRVVGKREVALLDLGDYRGERGMYRLVRQLDEYAQKPRAVVLDASKLALKWAQIEEVREAVVRVREAGGRVAIYLRGGSLRSYFLATAAEQVWAHPRSRLATVGLYSTVFYYRDLLAKLGARAEFVRIAEYKARPEQFSRTGPTEPAARQRQQVASDIFNHIVRLVAQDRGWTPEDVVSRVIDQAPHTPTQAQSQGMIEGLHERDALVLAAESWLGRPVKLRAPSSRPEHRSSFGPGPEVAIVYVEGVMVTGTSVSIPIVGQKLLGDRTIVPVLERLRKDRNVKAVVVRVDSVGGSVACADNIARELDRVRAVKPVVISMGSVAASGGYYVATGGQYILADATTRTGSIGIFLPKVDLSGVLEKFGVGASHFGLGKRAGMSSWFHPYTDDERQAAQAGIQASYDVFTARVAHARRLTQAQVDSLARGRVWSGVRATENGLVDRYGGLREAVMVAQQLAKLPPKGFDVREYPPPPGLVEQIQALFGLELPIPLRATLAGTPVAEELVLGAQYGPILAILSRLPASLWLGSPEPMALESAVFVLR